MKLEINIQAKDFEVANMLLGMAIMAMKEQPELRAKWKITEKEVLGAEKVKEKLLNAFLKKRDSKNGETNLRTDSMETLMMQINNPRLFEITENLKGDNHPATKFLIKSILNHLERAS